MSSLLCPPQLILAHDLVESVGLVLETIGGIGGNDIRELAHNLLRGLAGILKRFECQANRRIDPLAELKI